MNTRNLTIVAAALLSACSGPTETNVANVASHESGAPAGSVESDAAPLPPPLPGTPGGLPDDRAPLEEPSGPINAKSAEAAGQVVQSYGALIEQKRFAEAAKLWGDDSAAATFISQFKTASELHAQVGKPGDTEGAAGSIYITVPFALYGRLKAGGQFNHSGAATLRRVNDVDGSTEAQRRWHIEQIELGRAG